MPNKLRHWRRHRKLTQNQLGELANLSHVQVSRLERGTSFFSADSLNALAQALGVQPEDIVAGGAKIPPEVVEIQRMIESIPEADLPRALAVLRAFATQNH